MKLDDADSELKALGQRVCSVIECLTGQPVTFHEGSDWYKSGQPILVWLRVIGPKAKKHPTNSILVTATKTDSQLEQTAQHLGNNMYGEQTPEFVVKCNDAENFAGFLEFIGRAYKVQYST